MKKVILILLLLALLAGCADSKVQYPEQMPEDFAIRYSWAIGPENVYDTYEGILQKDLVLDGIAVMEFEPDREELEQIYQKIRELDIASIDREMTAAQLAKGDEMVAMTPLTVYKIQFTINGSIYDLNGDATASCYPKDKDAVRFMEFVEFMRDIMVNNREYKQMPKHNGGYD